MRAHPPRRSRDPQGPRSRSRRRAVRHTEWRNHALRAPGATGDPHPYRARPYQSVAACLIVKDEERDILRCLAAIRPYVDRIVLADTGSTDRTLTLAAPLVDEIRRIPAIGPGAHEIGFGEARNLSKARVTEGLILVVDADEVVTAGHLLCRYTTSNLFAGYVLRQQHLMTDVHGTYDSPLRLLRNLPQHQFTGAIHERLEDVSTAPFDVRVAPVLDAPELVLAHTGYLTDRQRRKKLSNRNLLLLKRDIEINGARRLFTWVLVIRDLVNVGQFHLESQPELVENGEAQLLLDAAVRCYLARFARRASPYEGLVYPIYQRALGLLGRAMLPAAGRATPPFEAAVGLTAQVGGLAGSVADPELRWFLDEPDLRRFADEQARAACRAMGISPDPGTSPQVGAGSPDEGWTDNDPALRLLFSHANTVRRGLPT